MKKNRNSNLHSINYEYLGQPSKGSITRIVWAHGWGQDLSAFKPMIQSLQTQYTHLVFDFPGFGSSALPHDPWSTEDYADAIAEKLLSTGVRCNTIWVGHSFGGRIGIQIAARHPELVNGLFLIASAGLKPHRSIAKKIIINTKIIVYKSAKKITKLVGFNEESLPSIFGSSDYKNAGPLRKIFIKVVNEDLSSVAEKIRCPVWLVYGENDSETPPEIGHRFSALIPNSKMITLDGQDHYSVLGDGRHQVILHLTKFLKEQS